MSIIEGGVQSVRNKHSLASCPIDKLNLDIGKFLLGVGEFHLGIDKYFLLNIIVIASVINFFNVLVDLYEAWVNLTQVDNWIFSYLKGRQGK